MNPAQEAQLAEIRDTIIREVHPQMIVLFGSQARGDAREDSDLDLLIVGEADPLEGRRARLGRLYCALGHVAVSKDLLLYTPQEVEAWRGSRNHIIGRALQEGRILYERAS
ncbi:MAG TPA: nucleotidyltransferase domain-containing protein [Geothrix sp.]|jgi:predicted nucleotidyltransferase